MSDVAKIIVDYTDDVLWDASKPDGILRKLLDVSRLTHLGWQACRPALGCGHCLVTGWERVYLN